MVDEPTGSGGTESAVELQPTGEADMCRDGALRGARAYTDHSTNMLIQVNSFGPW